jgi:hypothetical protein
VSRASRVVASRLPGWRVLVALAALAGCGEILAIPERTVDSRIACEGGDCVCIAGFDDCDGDLENGCEADLTSLASCGACGVVCRHATCQVGACLCDDGWDDCDGDPDNGCEADLASDASCGACGRACMNAVCTGGACECQSGFLDCDGDDTTGCEVNVALDPTSCGACGHDCLGGGCEGGKCLPVQVLDLVAINGVGYDLDVADGKAYVAACGLPVVPITGGQPTYLLPSTDCALYHPFQVAVAHGRVFWTDQDTVMSTPVAGGPSTQLAAGQEITLQLAVSDAHVYWWNELTSLLMRVPIDGGSVETVSSGYPSHLFINATLLAWFSGDFEALDLATQTVSTLLDGADFGYNVLRALDDDAIYFDDIGDMLRLDLGTAAVTPFARDGSTGATTDATHVYYWYEGDGSIKRAPKDGSGPPELMASQQGFEVLSQGTIRNDDEAVYWLTSDAVMKVAK